MSIRTTQFTEPPAQRAANCGCVVGKRDPDRGFKPLTPVLSPPRVGALRRCVTRPLRFAPPIRLRAGSIPHASGIEAVLRRLTHPSHHRAQPSDGPWPSCPTAIQFVYLMLPTRCNQACRGCFMGQDKSRLPPPSFGPFLTVCRASPRKSTLPSSTAHVPSSYGGGGELFTWRGAF